MADIPIRIQPIILQWVLKTFSALCMWWICLSYAGAQSIDALLEQAGVSGTILDVSPFDIITVSSDGAEKSVQVNLLDLPDRKLPSAPKPTDRLGCVLSIFPDRSYEVFWKDIVRVTLWEQIVLDRAKGLLAQKRFSESFEHLTYLVENYPTLPGLESLQQEFLFNSARDMATGGEFQHALTTLEELHRRFPTFRPGDIQNAISGVVGRYLDSLIQGKQYGTARALMNRMDETYQGKITSVARYHERLTALATTFKSESIAAKDRQEFISARRNASWMLEIDPNIAGGRELLLGIIRAYPMVRVGVLQPARIAAASAIGDWPAMRMGRLTQTPIFSFRSAGPEGGVYQFAYGSARLSDDRLAIEVTIQKNASPRVPSALVLSQDLLDRADVASERYLPDWSSILKSVSVPGPDRLTLNLRRPHVIPQAMIQWSLPDSNETSYNRALYGLDATRNDSPGADFHWVGESPLVDFQPRVIQEISYSSPGAAISDLLRGEIEVMDRLFPADARLLRGHSRIQVEPYSLPTVHMLVPKSDDPFLQNNDFRRALLYGINRQALLNDEILGGPASEMDRLISGPFPVGAGNSDAIAYANDNTLAPLSYDPRSAAILLSLAQSNVQSSALKKRQPVPKIPTIRLGVPNYEAAIVAGQAILQAWKVLGIEGNLSTYDHISDIEPNSLDLMYLTAAVWEPVTDAERLFGEGGPAETNNVYVVQSLTRLKAANNWKEVRDCCHELHAMVATQLPIMPLWQINEFFAYRKELQGVARKPVSLYQDIQRWRIQPQ